MRQGIGAPASPSGSRPSDQAALRPDASRFDPSRGGFASDMDRAFEIALSTLHLSAVVEHGARLFYADGLNNREGHVSERVAARVIAATFAALKALKDERIMICRYINQCADAFSTVPLEAASGGMNGAAAAAYSMDAILRYHSLSDHIHDRAHVEQSGETGA